VCVSQSPCPKCIWHPIPCTLHYFWPWLRSNLAHYVEYRVLFDVLKESKCNESGLWVSLSKWSIMKERPRQTSALQCCRVDRISWACFLYFPELISLLMKYSNHSNVYWCDVSHMVLRNVSHSNPSLRVALKPFPLPLGMKTVSDWEEKPSSSSYLEEASCICIWSLWEKHEGDSQFENKSCILPTNTFVLWTKKYMISSGFLISAQKVK
jgi:hypothetical protein